MRVFLNRVSAVYTYASDPYRMKNILFRHIDGYWMLLKKVMGELAEKLAKEHMQDG